MSGYMKAGTLAADMREYRARIAELEAEVERLREALEEIQLGGLVEYGSHPDYRARDEIAEIARRALEAEHE